MRIAKGEGGNVIRVAAGVALALGLTACTSQHNTQPGEATASTSPTNDPDKAASSPSNSPEGIPIHFDYRGVGSTIIDVYKGAQNTDFAHEVNGTYNSGDSNVNGECKTQGREIPIPDGVTEPKARRNDWIRFTQTDSEESYVPVTWTTNQGELLTLPDC